MTPNSLYAWCKHSRVTHACDECVDEIERAIREEERERCVKELEQYAAELHEDGEENVGRNIVFMAAHRLSQRTKAEKP